MHCRQLWQTDILVQHVVYIAALVCMEDPRSAQLWMCL